MKDYFDNAGSKIADYFPTKANEEDKEISDLGILKYCDIGFFCFSK